MKRITIIRTLTAVMLLQLAHVEVAGAFSFCFSFGGGGKHRTRAHDRYMPAIGFRPDYRQFGPASSPVYGWSEPPLTVLPSQQQGDRIGTEDRSR